MNVAKWLQEAVRKLEHAGIATARLDAEVLLADELGVDRSWLHAHPDHPLTRIILVSVEGKLERRVGHEPLAYIRGRQEFYGREFAVSPDTLTPRPETEMMIELLKEQLAKNHAELEHQELQIVDVGTGSGCVIVTAALELAHQSEQHSTLSFIGVDVSEKALQVARTNAERFMTDVELKHFDIAKDNLYSLLAPNMPTIILANLPYVPTNYPINQAASHEPSLAIFGGEDGLDYYRLLFKQLATDCAVHSAQRSGKFPNTINDKPSALIFTESLPTQHEQLAKIAQEQGYTQSMSRDFIQVFIAKEKQ